MKNRVVAAVMAAFAALGMSVQGVHAGEIFNLTADAVKTTGCLKFGWGPQHNKDTITVPADVFKESNENANNRFIGREKVYPNFFAVHFTDQYKPGCSLIVKRIAIVNYGGNKSNRRVTSVVLQGSNVGTGFQSGLGAVPADNEWNNDGWTDIMAFGESSGTMTWSDNETANTFDSGVFENNAPYRYYRLKIVSGADASYPFFNQFRLYGEAVSYAATGMTAECTPGLDSATVQLGAASFCESDASATGTVTVDYGTDPTFESGVTTVQVAEDATCPEEGWSAGVPLTGLESDTTYYGRYKVLNSHDVVTTCDFTFKTLSTAVGEISASYSPDMNAAVLRLGVDKFCVSDAASLGTVSVDYGTDPDFADGSFKTVQVGSGLSSQPNGWSGSVNLADLEPDVVYYGRCNVVNDKGAVKTFVFTFLALPVPASRLANLTSDAYSMGSQYRELGFGPVDGPSRMIESAVFNPNNPTTGGNERFMSLQDVTPIPNYLAFHFLDAYRPNESVFVNRLRMTVYSGLSSYKERRPTKVIVQGSADGAGFKSGNGTTDDARNDEGWVDITDEVVLNWSEVPNTASTSACDFYFANGTPYRYYRVKFTANGDKDWLQFSGLQLWGYTISLAPVGLAVDCTPGLESAALQLGVETFSEADPAMLGSVSVDYGTDPAFADGTYETVQVGTDLSSQPDGWSGSANLTGLEPDTTYYGRCTAVNAQGVSKTVEFSFTTLSKAVGEITVLGLPESTAADVQLTVNGFCIGSAAVAGTVFVDYSTDESFPDGSTTRVVVGEDVEAPTGVWKETVRLTDLTPGTVYYVRVTVSNAKGGESETRSSFATMAEVVVSAEGSDEDGDGSAERPYRSITKAVAENPVRPMISIGEGTYSAATGETFPIDLPEGTCLKGAGAETCRIDGGNVAVTLVRMSASGEACRISGVHFADTVSEPPILVQGAGLLLSACSFSQERGIGSATDETAGALRAEGAASVVVEDCAFALGTQPRHWVINTTGDVSDPGQVCELTVRRSHFTGNKVQYGLIGCAQQSLHNRYVIEDCAFDSNLVTGYNQLGKRAFPGAVINMTSLLIQVGGINTPYGELTVDRCTFTDNRANAVIGTQFTTGQSNVTIRNSLFRENVFYNVNSGALYGVIYTYYGTPSVQNCTFIRNGGHYCQKASATFRNVIFSGEGPLINNFSYSMGLYGAVVHDTDYGTAPSQILRNAALGEVIEADPCFADADGRLKDYSPAIDAGVGVFGTSDLDGRPRALDNLLSGTARPDFGCYESTYNAETEPTFHLPERGALTQSAGHKASVTVTLAAPGDVKFPLEATVTYPEGFTGPETLTFESATATLEFTPPHDAIGAFDVGISAEGVVSGVLRVNVVDSSIKLFGDRLKFLRAADGALEIPVTMAMDGALAPEAIDVEIVSLAGEGTTTVAWSDEAGRGIAKGASASTAKLVFTPGEGHNVLTLRTAGTFAETDGDTLVIDLVAAPDAIHASAKDGSDEKGIGTAAAPFKSLTKALAYVQPGDTVRLAAGTYSAESTGEAFPITAVGVTLAGETGGEAETVLDGANVVANLFKLESNDDPLVLRDLVLANSTEAIADLMDGAVTMERCRLVQTGNNNDQPLAVYMFRASKVVMTDCTVVSDLPNLSRESVFTLNTTSADLGLALSERTNDRWLTVTGCTFGNLRFQRGLVTSRLGNGSPNVTSFTGCDFRNLRMYTNTPGISGNGGNVYQHAIFHVPTGISAGNSTCSLRVDRCRFAGCKDEALVSTSHCLPPQITNCLFVDMTNAVGFLNGNYVGSNNAGVAKVVNCTFVRSTGAFTSYTDSADTTGLRAEAHNCIFVDSEIAPNANVRATTITDSILFNTPLGEYAEGVVTIDANTVREVDPRLRADGSIKPLSPAYNTGNNAYVSGELDLLGNPRIFKKVVDLGAIECQESAGMMLFLR